MQYALTSVSQIVFYHKKHGENTQMKNLPVRKPNRLKNYDYSRNGAYFVTILVENRAEIFGKIENGKMILNEYGQIVQDEWL